MSTNRKLQRQGLVPVSLEALQQKASRRAPGYLDAFLAKAVDSGTHYFIEQVDLDQLTKDFSLPRRNTRKAASTPKPQVTRTAKFDISKRENDVLALFFECGGANLFDGAEALYQRWESDLETAGGDRCPGCVRNALRRQYAEQVLAKLDKL